MVILKFLRLPDRAAQAAAILTCAIIFAAVHNNADAFAFGIRTAGGILYGVLRYASGSVAASALMHAGHNLGSFTVARALAAP